MAYLLSKHEAEQTFAPSAVSHYVQKYSAYQSAEMNRATYTDYTRKTVAVYIDILEVPQSDGNTENVIRVLLGDVDCEGQAW